MVIMYSISPIGIVLPGFSFMFVSLPCHISRAYRKGTKHHTGYVYCPFCKYLYTYVIYVYIQVLVIKIIQPVII